MMPVTLGPMALAEATATVPVPEPLLVMVPVLLMGLVERLTPPAEPSTSRMTLPVPVAPPLTVTAALEAVLAVLTVRSLPLSVIAPLNTDVPVLAALPIERVPWAPGARLIGFDTVMLPLLRMLAEPPAG